jgi:hypothetical protein
MSHLPPCFSNMLVPNWVPVWVSPASFFHCAFSRSLTQAVDPLTRI